MSKFNVDMKNPENLRINPRYETLKIAEFNLNMKKTENLEI